MLRSKSLSCLWGACLVLRSTLFCRAAASSNTLNSRLLSSYTNRTMAYSIRESGSPNSLDYRMYYCDGNGHALSPWHDIPLFANSEKTVMNMVVEIPRWTNAKMEINVKEALNPIKQDVKKGKLRFVDNCFPYHGYIWNYGAFPQTWEDPSHKDNDTGCLGDNDPIDVCDIGTMGGYLCDKAVNKNHISEVIRYHFTVNCPMIFGTNKVAERGEIKQVKVLGIIAMIDEGETDWKVIVIDVNDSMAKDINDIDDVEKHMPGLLKATVDWFRIYKVPTGKPENSFAFDAEAKDKQFAMKIINETHAFWKQLVTNKTENKGGLACKTVTISDSPYKMSQEDADAIVNNTAPAGSPQPIDPEVGRWHFVERS